LGDSLVWQQWGPLFCSRFFGVAMTVSFGIKAPLNFSVFVDAAAALLLSVWPVMLRAPINHKESGK
jgi:hypothetical protein